LIDPPRFTEAELGRDLLIAVEEFRRERMEEPLEDYLEAFEEYLGTTEELLEATVDLSELESQALTILSSESLLYAFRYIAGPPISQDDLKTLADVTSLTPSRLSADPAAVRRIIETVQIGLDRKRFPWVVESREPTEGERQAAARADDRRLADAKRPRRPSPLTDLPVPLRDQAFLRPIGLTPA